MGEVNNLTPFSCMTHPHVDEQGRHCQLLIVKGIWNLQTNRLADHPGPLGLRSQALTLKIGELALEAVQQQTLQDQLDEEIDWLPSDLIPPKRRFDLLVCGYAYSDNGGAQRRFRASIGFKDKVIGLTLWGPRYWRKTLFKGGGAVPSVATAAVSRVPLHPRFSYGGPSHGGASLFNPQGMGSPTSGDDLSRVALPWVEHPKHPLVDAVNNPQPAAFGAWAENASHRRRYMGTYDEAWKQQRAPRYPLDFNPLFHNQAEPRLQWDRAPRPGQVIDLHHLSPRGSARLVWPKVSPLLQIDGRSANNALHADTCVIAPDEERYAIVWRALAPMGAELTLRATSN